ncbi:hypothetical protein JTB14_011932 [Gonioctena quinquepunctata]|nr:hypothetical protein JTB14_011932 [Gonioctena quinquepunctata]
MPDELKMKIIEDAEAPAKDGKFYGSNNKKQFHHKFTKNKNNKFRSECQKCFKEDHKTENCRSANNQKESTFKVEACLSVSSPVMENRNYFLCLDSGSTSHMCFDEKKLLI